MIPPVEGNISPAVFFSPGGEIDIPFNMQLINRIAIPSFLEKLQDPQALLNPEGLHRHKKVNHLKQEQLLHRMLSQVTTIAAQAIQTAQTQKQPEQSDFGNQKSPESQRDEIKAKGKEAIGEDIVNIQVFAGEKGAKKESNSGSQENLAMKQEIPAKLEAKEKGQPALPKEFPTAGENLATESKTIPNKHVTLKEAGKETEKPKTGEKEVIQKSPAGEQEISKTQSKEPNVVQAARVMSEDEKEKPGRALEKEIEREKVENVQGDDKYRSVEHPRGHRVMEHGRAELRQRPEDAQQQASAGEIHRHMKSGLIVPIFSGWYLPSFIQDQEQAKGKAGSKKILSQMQEHNLGDLLFMIFTATQEGAKTIAEVVEYIESRTKWFTGILGLRNGMPSRQMIWWLLAVLDPKMFNEIVLPWLYELQGKSSGKGILPFISLWETPIGLLFGQSQKGDESVDRIAVPQVLKALDLSHAVVMTQIVDPVQSGNHIGRKGGDYILEIDESQGETYENVLEQLEKGIQTKSIKTFESFIEGQERIVIQVLPVQTEAKTKAFVRVTLETPALVGVHAQRRYYATSEKNVEYILFDMIRVQAQVENKVEWLLNTAFQLTSFDAAMSQCSKNLILFGQKL